MIQPSISNLLKRELSEVLFGQQLKEISDQINNLTLKTVEKKHQAYTIYLRCKNFEQQSVQYDYHIKIDSLRESKIFKVSAQNQRYKTTALLIIAILLGYYIKDTDSFMISNLSFEDKREILNNDRLLQRMDNLKNVIFNLDEVDRLNLKNREIILEIRSGNQEVFAVYIDNKKIDVKSELLEKNITLELSGDKTYDQYMRVISELSLFTPHLISKGRNFVKYILVEESKKYWYSLEIIIERLKSLQIKWFENGPRLTKEEIQNKVLSIEFLSKACSKYPEYFLRRDDFLKYLELKKKLDGIGTQDNILSDKNKELETLKEFSKAVRDELFQFFDTLTRIVNTDALGDYRDRFHFFERLFTGETSPKLEYSIDPVNIEKNLSIRNFKVMYDENGHSKINLIQSYLELDNVLQTIDKLQSSFYEGSIYFNNNKKKIKEKIQVSFEYKIKISMLEKELEELSANYRLIDEYKRLESELFQDLPKLESIQDYHRELIEKNIHISSVRNFENLHEELEKTKALMKTDLFNNEKLSLLLNNIVEAYEVFGKEVGNMSKGSNIPSSSYYVNDNVILNKMVSIFEEDIVNRCSHYFKSTSEGVKAFKVKKYDFRKRIFFSEENDILDLQNGLSGGTDSVMTVYSLATTLNETLLGNILLVDEWGDVSTSFHKKVMEKLNELDTFALALFVDVDDRYDEINTFSEGEDID